jgi:hypothetical protein
MLISGMKLSLFTAAVSMALAVPALALPQAPAAAAPARPSTLVVFMQGMPLGSEEVTVSSDAGGWTIRATGRLGAPANLSTARFEAVYDAQWKPVRLEVDGSLRGQAMTLRTVFTDGSAASEVLQAGQQTRKTDTVAADTLILPNMFFAAYEALAQRLATAKPGDEFKAYVVPQAEIDIQVLGVSEERIRTATSTVAARLYSLTFVNPGGPVAAEAWIDEQARLLRFRVAAQGLEVAREDIATVSARVERMTRAGDEQVRMPSVGFSLAGTLSKPAMPPLPPGTKNVPRLPAVILVPGSGPVDRDETVAGISVFAQLANTLADAGFLVVRYDKRGVGQSGGRDESATLDDYAEDVRAAVAFLRKRKDVDEHRIAVVGHSEGGLVGMLASTRDRKRIAALVLVATPGTNGGDLVLEQQARLLDAMQLPEGERRNRIELQQKIQQAVISGTGWEAIPPGFRRQAETPWFRSFLLFDPVAVMRKIEEPVLIIQGARDRQVSVRHAHRLAEAGRARKRNPGTDLVIVDGINHLLVPAPTGEVSEYPTLTDKKVSAQVLDELTKWLKERLPEPAGKK